VPPVAIEQCSIVTNVDLFIRSSLADLEDSLNRRKKGGSCWTISQMLDRLRQVGMVLELEKTATNQSGE
jgi:hypothetical protein